jgi:hypothetical protein
MRQCLPFEIRRRLERERRQRRAEQIRTPAQELRDRYLDLFWTRKSCVLCGRPSFQLHHARYRCRPAVRLLHLVPLCEHHHRDFTFNVWPKLKPWMGRTDATLAYIVHGERLHLVLSGPKHPPRPAVSPDQIRLFGD